MQNKIAVVEKTTDIVFDRIKDCVTLVVKQKSLFAQIFIWKQRYDYHVTSVRERFSTPLHNVKWQKRTLILCKRLI